MRPKCLEHAEIFGPVARDFATAFKVGCDNKSLSSVDASGVALSAIKGLNELVKEKNCEIAKPALCGLFLRNAACFLRNVDLLQL